MGKTFEADLDIINLGIYLFENGHFKDRLAMHIYYFFALTLTMGTKIYFVFLAYK